MKKLMMATSLVACLAVANSAETGMGMMKQFYGGFSLGHGFSTASRTNFNAEIKGEPKEKPQQYSEMGYHGIAGGLHMGFMHDLDTAVMVGFEFTADLGGGENTYDNALENSKELAKRQKAYDAANETAMVAFANTGNAVPANVAIPTVAQVVSWRAVALAAAVGGAAQITAAATNIAAVGVAAVAPNVGQFNDAIDLYTTKAEWLALEAAKKLKPDETKFKQKNSFGINFVVAKMIDDWCPFAKIGWINSGFSATSSNDKVGSVSSRMNGLNLAVGVDKMMGEFKVGGEYAWGFYSKKKFTFKNKSALESGVRTGTFKVRLSYCF